MNILSLLTYETPAQNTFSLFGKIDIYYYAICMVMAIAVAACLSMLIMHRRNISTDIVLVGFIICVPSAIVGARFYSCFSEVGFQRTFQLVTLENGMKIPFFLNFRAGGMSIMGSLLGGAISAAIFCMIKKYNFLRLADCILPTLPLAQAIGRWGNYFNQEVFGRVVTNESLQFFPFSVFIEADGKWHYAFFFYEGLVNFVWFIVLFLIAWNMVKKPNGLVTGMFAAFYGTLRAVMEPLRDVQYQYGVGETIDSSLVASYVLIFVGIALIVTVLVLNKRNEGKILGSAYGDEYVVTKFMRSEKNELPLYTSVNIATKLIKQGKIKAEFPPETVKKEANAEATK